MSQTTQYPMNFYSRAITNASGTAPSWLIFLNHADRATVSSGTWFVDSSPFNSQLFARSNGVIQDSASAYFGAGGVLFPNASNGQLVWLITGITVTTATPTRPAMQIEALAYLTSLNTSGMYWFDVVDQFPGTNTYARSYIYETAGNWRLNLQIFQAALGLFFSHDYALPTITTGSWMHLMVVRVDSQAPGSNRIGVFHNGSQLPLIAGGNPTTGTGQWSDCGFAFAQGSIWSWGGLAAASANSWIGKLDEMRIIWDTVDALQVGIGTDLASFYYVDIPSAPYSPADGTYNITAKVLSLGSATLSPTTTNTISLGNTGQEYVDLWSAGTAYLTNVGRSFSMVGTTRINFGTTSVYLFSSSSGYLTLVAGTQIDLQSNIGVAAKNFIFDTVTGVTFGTATNQKLAFWGATPIVRPASTSDIKDSLVNLGLITDGGATPLNLDGGKVTAGSGSFSGSVVVAGAFFATGYHYQVTQLGTGTTSYSLTTANDVLLISSVNNTSVILPQATVSGKLFWLKNIATAGTVQVNVGTVASSGIDGVATYSLTSGQSKMFFDGANILTGSGSLGSWTYRRLVTVSTDTAVAVGTQASFPALVRLTTANFNFANARSDGADIRFLTVASDIALNYNRLFYGYTLDTTTNVIAGATMVGDATGGAWATVTSVSDGNDATFANSFDGAGPHWFRCAIGTAKKVNYLRIKPYGNANGKTIKNFTFEGSNDTTGAWTTIASLYHEQNSNYESYVFTNDTAYLFYRMNFSNSWQTSGLIGIYEIQMYSNGSTQMGLFMVNVPTVAAGTTFYVYYGNATATDASSTLVWDSNVAAFWPMGSFTTGSVAYTADYTSNARNATTYIASTVYGRPNLVWNSLWGYTLAFYGSQLLSVADSSVWDDGMTNWTWTMWIVESATGGNKAYISRGSDGSSYLYWGKDNGAPLRWRDFNGGPDLNAFSPSVTGGSVTMLTMKRSSNNFELYKNNASIGTASNAATLLSRTTPLWIGAHTGINYFINGTMWNVQIETVARGTDWIKTKYFSDVDLLMTVGNEGTFSSQGTTQTLNWTTF